MDRATSARWLLGGITAITLGITACSHDTQALQTKATHPATDETTTTAAGGTDACDLVTLHDAEAVTHTSLRPDPNRSGQTGPDCTYLPDRTDLTIVKIHLDHTDTTQTTPSTAPGATIEEVPDLGDHAIAIDDTPVGALAVNQDGTTITITVTDGTTNDLDAEKALAQTALTRL